MFLSPSLCRLLAGLWIAVPGILLAAPAAPTHLVAFPGGNSIALRWDGSSGATSYRVFRGGTHVATVVPGFHALFPERDGNGYIDGTASPGHTYAYQVQAVGSGGAVSPKSTTLSVAFAAPTTPLPTLTLDSSQAGDLAAWLQDTVKPFVLAWYPKVADRLAWPDYTPPHAFTIRIDPAYDGVAYTDADTIVVSADYARANPHDLGMVLHEATHVVQQHARGGWITEGMADWVRDAMLRDRAAQALPVGASYFDGYGSTGYFFDWIERQHPGFVRALNLVKHAGTSADDDPDSVFRDLAGATPNRLWFAMTGTPAGAELRFTRYKDRCVVGPPGNSGPAMIRSCNRDVTGQQWTFRRHGSNLVLAIGDNCLDVVSSGTANGTPLQMWWDCNETAAQDWRLQADGTLRNPQSGRCLYAPSTTVTTQLQLQDCAAVKLQVLGPRPGEPVRFTGLSNVCVGTPGGGDVEARGCDVTAADQMWHVRGNADGTLSLVIVSGECLDVQGSGTSNGTPVQIWGCNDSGAQKWRLRADGALVNPQSGRCLDAGSGAIGTHLQLWTCSGDAGQALLLPPAIFADGFD